MKRFWMLVSLCALAAPLAWAAPNPAYVPADADVVLVAQGEDEAGQAKAAAFWEALLREAGVDVEAVSQMQEQNIEALPKEGAEILRAVFGFSEDWKTSAVRSAVYAIAFPRTVDKEKGPDRLFFTVVLENPKADVAAIDRAVQALLKKGGTQVRAMFVKDGEWSCLRLLDQGLEGRQAYIAWRSLPEGLAIVCGLDFEVATARFAGKGKALAADDPLMAAFTAPAGAKHGWFRLAVRDVGELAERLFALDPEARQRAALAVPWLAKTHALSLTAWSPRLGDGAARLVAKTEDAQAAKQLRDQLLGFKGLLGQMVLPALTQKPDSAFAKLVASVQCEAAGTEVVLSQTVGREDLVPLVKEWMELAQRQQEAQSAAAGRRPTVSDEGEDFDDEDEPMSEEDARAILEGLETL